MPAFVLYLPEMLFADDMAHGGLTGSSPGLLVDEAGNVSGLVTEDGAPAGTKVVRMPGKALLPGIANAPLAYVSEAVSRAC